MIITFSDRLSHAVRLVVVIEYAVLTPGVLLLPVWPLPLSLAATHRISFDFSSSAYLDVSVQRVPFVTLCIHVTIHSSSLWGFPHSEIHGSMHICYSPWLIAACHVLLRLLMPRHSPYALYSLNLHLACSLYFESCLSFVLIIVVCFFYHLSGKIAVFLIFPLLTRKTILIFKIVFLNYLFVYSLFDFQWTFLYPLLSFAYLLV